MAIDTDNNQDSLLPFPEGQEEAKPRRRSDRTSKQAAKATRRPPGRPPRSVAPLASPELPPAPETKPVKRGRPPKNAQAPAVETQRRKPGRPPKSRIAEVPPPPPLVPVPPPPAIFEEPVVEALEVVELAPTPVPEPVLAPPVATAPRRGPGRPRKVQTIDTPPPPATVPAKPAMPILGILAEPGNRIGEMGVHAVGFFRALFNLGATSDQAKPPEIEVLTTKDVARIVQAKESEVIQAITSGQLRATPIGKSWRTTPGNVKIWLEG